MATPPPSRFTWRRFFERSSSAVFVFGGNRRLRYANPAWERLTGESFAKLRGLLVSAQRSLSPFAPPPEAWAGRQATVRRAAAGAPHGPPWWDLLYVPLLGEGETRVLGVVGVLTVVGEAKPLPRVKVPEAVAAVRAAHAARYPFDLLAGPAAAGQRLASQARAAAVAEMPVWIVGEPGAGKETLARVIHHHSPRRERAFVGLACGGVQPYLIEGMLFGKGGLAGGPHAGTLYLKHPAELPRPLQDRILAWCESAVGPRLICGAAATAAELVAAGSLAPPFHTRFSALEVRVPPLRERLDDLPQLLSRLGDTPPPPDVLEALRAYPWPGNIRELVEVAGLAGGGPLTRDLLPRAIRERHLIATAPPPDRNPPTLDELLESVERRAIQLALAKANGNAPLAAEWLGVPRARVWRRMAALGIPLPPPLKARKKPDEGPE
jgi:transcriptional regulator with PAS, ATPase and Fis domain